MDEAIAIPGMFFVTVMVLAIGVPLVRAHIRRTDAGPRRALDPAAGDRLERIEQAIEAVAIEVERISEGQRFVTRLLADRPADRVAISDAGRHQP